MAFHLFNVKYVSELCAHTHRYTKVLSKHVHTHDHIQTYSRTQILSSLCLCCISWEHASLLSDRCMKYSAHRPWRCVRTDTNLTNQPCHGCNGWALPRPSTWLRVAPTRAFVTSAADGLCTMQRRMAMQVRERMDM